MDVHVRLGPGLLQQVGTPRLTVSLAPGSTVLDLRQHLRTSYPSFSENSGTVLAVIGGATVAEWHILQSGNEVALLLPVSGGSVEPREERPSWL
jgi:molybdopterin converting factor small subunit